MAGGTRQQLTRLAGKALAVAGLLPELPAHEHAHAADAGPCGLGQALPGALFADFATLQGQPGAGLLVAIATPWRFPTALAAEEYRVGDQLYRLLCQLLMVFRVPAVTAHQYTQAPGRVCTTCRGCWRPSWT